VSVRSIGQGAGAASSARITAAARVERNAVVYRGLAKNVRSPACAVSIPATRRISISPSPSSRHSRRAATSRSFKPAQYITRRGTGRTRSRLTASMGPNKIPAKPSGFF